MSWRLKLGIPATSDSSDNSGTSVTSVTGSPYIQKTGEGIPSLCPDPERSDFVRARYILNRAGVRIMQRDGVTTIGVWSDLDGPEIRGSLLTSKNDQLPVCYLDGVGIPVQYKSRRVAGEPVPMSVLAEMERHPATPWTVRDRTLKEIGWVPGRHSGGRN